MKYKMLFIITLFILFFFESIVLAGTSLTNIDRIIKKYGKQDIIEIILQERGSAISIQVDNSIKETFGTPDEHYVNKYTIKRDLDIIGMSTKKLEKRMLSHIPQRKKELAEEAEAEKLLIEQHRNEEIEKRRKFEQIMNNGHGRVVNITKNIPLFLQFSGRFDIRPNRLVSTADIINYGIPGARVYAFKNISDYTIAEFEVLAKCSCSNIEFSGRPYKFTSRHVLMPGWTLFWEIPKKVCPPKYSNFSYLKLSVLRKKMSEESLLPKNYSIKVFDNPANVDRYLGSFIVRNAGERAITGLGFQIVISSSAENILGKLDKAVVYSGYQGLYLPPRGTKVISFPYPDWFTVKMGRISALFHWASAVRIDRVNYR